MKNWKEIVQKENGDLICKELFYSKFCKCGARYFSERCYSFEGPFKKKYIAMWFLKYPTKFEVICEGCFILRLNYLPSITIENYKEKLSLYLTFS